MCFILCGRMCHGECAFDGSSGPFQEADGRGLRAAAAAAAAGKMLLLSPATAARWGNKVRDGDPLEPLPSVPRKGSGKPKPFVAFFVELIEQAPDITLVELRGLNCGG